MAHRPSSQWGQKWEYQVTVFQVWPVQRNHNAVYYWRRFTVSACLLKCYTCSSQTLKLPKPSYAHEEVVSHPSPKSSSPVKEMESLWSAWWSFILSPRQINSLMIDLDGTCMKNPFIYSWNLICPLLGSEALDKKWQNGKTQSSKKDRLFILLMPFSPSALQFSNTKNSYWDDGSWLKLFLYLNWNARYAFFFNVIVIFTCAQVCEPQLKQSSFIHSIVTFTTMWLFSPTYISHTLGMEYGTVNVKYCCKKKVSW